MRPRTVPLRLTPRKTQKTENTTESELTGYVQAFKDSSDRSRRFIFVVTTITILFFVAEWNLSPSSWATARLLRALERQNPYVLQPPDPASREQWTLQERRKAVFDRYPDLFVDRMLLIQLPAVGITTDVNEFGLFGGITLLLLMLLLWSALSRQHENLQLCMFKIKKLFERENRPNDGESRANYLYHALAMTQMLCVPPTLARWNHRRYAQSLRFAFFIPATLQTWTAWTNGMTRQVAEYYFGHVPERRIAVQHALAAGVWIVAMMCYFTARAMDKRWVAMFFRLNPALDAKAPESLRLWLKIDSRWTAAEKSLRKHLRRALLAGSGGAGSGEDSVALAPREEPLLENRITRFNAGDIAFRLQKHARTAALQECRALRDVYPELTSFSIHSTTPVVTIDWTYRIPDSETERLLAGREIGARRLS